MSSNKITRVRLEVYASQLKNVAGAFKGTSDPYAVVTQLPSDPREKPKVLGKTEVIKNTLCPKWTKHFELDYEIGRLTRINVGIYDEIRKSADKAMGSAFFEVGEVLGARGNAKAKKLRKGGTVYVRITAAPTHQDGSLHLAFRGVGIKNVDGLFSKSDPFFEISSRANAAGGLTWHPIYRSKPIMDDLNPKWPPFSLDVSRLCEGNLDQPILVTLWDWQKQGNHKPLGCFETTVNGLLHAKVRAGTGTASSVDTSKAFIVKHKGKEYGKLVVTTALIEGGKYATPFQGAAPPVSSAPPMYAPIPPPSSSLPGFSQALDRPTRSFRTAATAVTAASNISHKDLSRPTAAPVPYVPEPLPPPMVPDSSMYTSAPPRRPQFVDYLTGGCELEMCVAIDFTGSNGDPRRPGTLHYLHPDGQLNDYEKALTAVGSIIARYDSDQMFPVYGFGAKYSGVIQHCFQVGNAPELSRLSGVLEAYRQVFRTGLVMSGPTVFSEVINLSAARARSQQQEFQRIGKQSYKILLILTDGAVSNVEETKQAIRAASDAPLSIVIVGIGDADFSAMRFLDDFAKNGGGGRDICQFVEFNRYKHDRSALTQETLAEIPDQLVDYFYGNGIMPLPPISGSQLSLAASEPDEEDIDLSLDINDEGEISVGNYNGPVYDDTKYDTISHYHVGSAPSAPIQPMAPPGPAAYVPQPQSYQPTAPSQSSYNPQSQASLYKPYSASVPPPAPNVHGHGSQYSHMPHAPQQQQSGHYGGATASKSSPIFHVQVPPGVRPGQQLQVRNPATQQLLLVTVPPGVAPGGKFAVRS